MRFSFSKLLASFYHIFFFPRKPVYGVSYSVFDGEELLEPSIRSIRSQVDYINVVYQTTGWSGDKASEELVPLLHSLKERGLIDEIIEYKKTNAKPKTQERRKRNLGMRHALKAGVNLFMPMDTDEFYQENDLIHTKEWIERKKLSNTICPVVHYTAIPTERIINEHGISFVMFFSKIHFFSLLGKSKFHPAQIDPTRQLKFFFPVRVFALHTVFMHHLSLIRKDFDKKARNCSEEFKRSILSKHIDYSTVKILHVPDIFNIYSAIPELQKNTHQPYQNRYTQ